MTIGGYLPGTKCTCQARVVDAGFASDTSPGLASLALRMMEEGTSTRPSLAISEQFEALGAQFSVRNNLDGAFIDLNVLKATMPRALDVYADIVLHPAFDQKELERIRKDQLAAIAREKVNPATMALRVIPGCCTARATPTRCQ